MEVVHCLHSESEGSVCRLNQTCCSVKAQEFMKESISSHYHNRISDIISAGMLECYNHNITGEKSVLCNSNVFSKLTGKAEELK